MPPNTDDIVIPFRVEHIEASGRLVRLGSVIDDILTRHDYPDKVSEILGQALLLVSMFGSMIKDRQSENTSRQEAGFKERFILQTQTDGPVNLIVADYVYPGHLRGYARFDQAKLDELEESGSSKSLLGQGHLAMTIDRGSDTDRYQGIVSLDEEGENQGLSGAANLYFQQSEQLPTFIHLAMAKHFMANQDDSNDQESDPHSEAWRWRGGALMVQKLTSVGGHKTKDHDWNENSEDPEDDSWNRTLILSKSIKDHELLDPLLSSKELLFHLYHQDGVRAFDSTKLEANCSCSQKGVERMLAGFTRNERTDMVKDDGKVHITCEFCNRDYKVLPATI